MTEKPRNAMQAVLDRAAQAEPRRRSSGAASERPPKARATSSRLEPPSNVPRGRTPGSSAGISRPRLGRQLRILAAEEDTTVQALLEEAIDLLLAKKARGRASRGKRVMSVAHVTHI